MILSFLASAPIQERPQAADTWDMAGQLESFAPILVVAVIAALAVFIVKRIKKHQAERARVLQEFGFIECKPVDPAVVEKLASLTSVGKSKAIVKHLYRRQQGAFDFYLADFDSAGDSDSAELDTIVMISPDAALPRFSVMPHIPGHGRISSLANSLLSHVARRHGFKDVAVSPGSEFDRKYGLFAPQSEPVLSAVSTDAWESLAAIPQLLSIEAGGDTISFSILLQNAKTPARHGHEDYRDYVRTHIEVGERIQEILACSHARSKPVSAR
jgi:hypothetical protein